MKLSISTLILVPFLAISNFGCGSSSGGGGGGGGATYNYYAYVSNYSSSTISAYSMNASTGALTSISGTFSTGTNPNYVVAHPSGSYLYVMNRTALTISAFSIAKTTGVLTAMSGSPYTPTAYTALYQIAMDPLGNNLYVFGAIGSGNYYVGVIPITSSTGALGTLTNTAITSSTSPLGYPHPNGKYLYITTSASGPNSVAPYTINSSGTLTAGTSQSVGSSGGAPGVTVDPSGVVLYSMNFNSGAIFGFTINASTGALTPATGGTTSTGFTSVGLLTIDPSSKFLAASGATTSGQIALFSINTSTAALSAVTGSPYTIGTTSFLPSFDPTGKFFYVPDTGSTFNGNTLYGYSYNASTGALTALSPATYTTGTAPGQVAIVKVQQ